MCIVMSYIEGGEIDSMKKKTTGVKINEYIKKGQGVIDRGIKSGFEADMLKKWGTLDVNELVKSKAGLEKLKKEGYPAFITEKGGYYLVQVGAFRNLSNAVRMEGILRSSGYQTYITT